MPCPTTDNHKPNCAFCVHYVCDKQFHTFVTTIFNKYAYTLHTISPILFVLINTQLRAQQNTSRVSLTSVTARNVGCVWQGAQRGSLCYDFNNCLCIEYVSMCSRCQKTCYLCILSHNRTRNVLLLTHLSFAFYCYVISYRPRQY